MTAFELKADLEKRTEEANALAQLWTVTIGTAPEPAQFYRWLGGFGFDTTKAAIERTARKFESLNGAMDENYRRKYCTSVAKQRYEQGGAA